MPVATWLVPLLLLLLSECLVAVAVPRLSASCLPPSAAFAQAASSLRAQARARTVAVLLFVRCFARALL